MSRALWHEGGGSALIACTFFTQRMLVEPPSSCSRRVFSRAWQRRASRWRCCRRVRPWSVVSCFRARDCLAQPHSLLAGAAGLPSLKALLASEWDDSGAFACGWIRLGVGRHRRFGARDRADFCAIVLRASLVRDAGELGSRRGGMLGLSTRGATLPSDACFVLLGGRDAASIRQAARSLSPKAAVAARRRARAQHAELAR